MLNTFEIAKYFAERGYQWTFTDGRRIPTEDEIENVITRAVDALADEPDLTQLEVGRLIVQKHGQFYDVYVHIAQLNTDDE